MLVKRIRKVLAGQLISKISEYEAARVSHHALIIGYARGFSAYDIEVVGRDKTCCLHNLGVHTSGTIFQPLRDKYHTLFSSRTSSMRSFFAQKERMSVYKFILDCLDMINA